MSGTRTNKRPKGGEKRDKARGGDRGKRFFRKF